MGVLNCRLRKTFSIFFNEYHTTVLWHLELGNKFKICGLKRSHEILLLYELLKLLILIDKTLFRPCFIKCKQLLS